MPRPGESPKTAAARAVSDIIALALEFRDQTEAELKRPKAPAPEKLPKRAEAVTPPKKTSMRSFVRFCQQLVDAPDFQERVLEMAYRTPAIMLRILDYGAGKPVQKIQEDKRIEISWGGSKPESEKELHKRYLEKKALREATENPVVEAEFSEAPPQPASSIEEEKPKTETEKNENTDTL